MSTREPGNQSPGAGPQPSLRPTSPGTLVVAGLVSAALAWVIINRFYGDIPDLNWLPGVTLAALAVVEAVAARNTKARIDHKRGTPRVDPLLVARWVVLAKASSLAGAIFGGAYGGVAVWAIVERGTLRVADTNLVPAIAGLVGGLALVAAALWLEHSCRVPPSADDEQVPPGP
ncbi:DUF3180 domain-containing protein [Luedemannella flava]|uniref:DUF3180 domain-containing protein n=1 Tax=Luedemannella flava TaxID=349316 RepID=A0ABN2MDT0_9ACTN